MSERKVLSQVRSLLRKVQALEQAETRVEEKYVYHSLKLALESFVRHAPEPRDRTPKVAEAKPAQLATPFGNTFRAVLVDSDTVPFTS